MKVLKEGRLHKWHAWFSTCNCCTSELRILEGDPQAGETHYICDTSQYYIRYICPVCGYRNVAYTNSSFGKKANAKYKEIILVEEDREEIDNWGIQTEVIKNVEDLKFLHNRERV